MGNGEDLGMGTYRREYGYSFTLCTSSIVNAFFWHKEEGTKFCILNAVNMMKGEATCICSSYISSWCFPEWQTWAESTFHGEFLGSTQRDRIKTISCTATLRLFLLRENWANIIGKVGKYLCLPDQMDRLPVKGSRKQCVVSFHYIITLPRKYTPCMRNKWGLDFFHSNIK